LNLIRPFTALRPAPGKAQDILAPPYDVLNSSEARERVQGQPHSFLHVSKPEVDLPAETDPHSHAVYAKGAENLNRLLDTGLMVRDPLPRYHVYRLTMGERQQTGVAAGVSVAAYENGQVKRHELTRPDKETDRVRHMEALDAQTGPVMMAYQSTAAVNALVEASVTQAPEIDAIGDGPDDVVPTSGE